ncbi:2-hydroxyacyl-CoA dehydratase [Geobacter sp. FeAm09]|uniref:2-hydroxyacyl-CoA dehydratase subunit D n=1 Tax=Geobacter sp. FeAm09 TaxID=2597769 RepID=UPI0011EFB41B|nr:2-hydroxyacyl-CoA dehydratase family protein [Geobacter sp. FeAm09]QEM67698.1 2-hydroxyacyl-CoA dehydratase [Geobacter sp. FeAm09]
MPNTLKSIALQQLQEAAGTLAGPAVKEWKQQGGKVLGCMYNYIPEELITAAGLLPYRMRATGSTGSELSETCFTQVNCSLVRHFFDSGLRGDLGFLDGVVSVNNCDHMRRLYDNWVAKIKVGYQHFMPFPKKSGLEQVEAYRLQLERFKAELEEHFGVEITDEKLCDAITLHNETRGLQRRLHELRKGEAPPITGAEAMAVMVAGGSMPRKQYNAILKQLLDDCANAEGISDYKARLMVIGGELDDPKLIEIIESQGGLVVADSLGYGSRGCACDVDTTGDLLTALSRYQLMQHPADPRINGTSAARNAYASDMATSGRVDGVVAVRLPQCDLWGLELLNLSRHFKRDNIPYLSLEVEYVLGSIGQLKTRVQAFTESIVEAKHVK